MFLPMCCDYSFLLFFAIKKTKQNNSTTNNQLTPIKCRLVSYVTRFQCDRKQCRYARAVVEAVPIFSAYTAYCLPQTGLCWPWHRLARPKGIVTTIKPHRPSNRPDGGSIVRPKCYPFIVLYGLVPSQTERR